MSWSESTRATTTVMMWTDRKGHSWKDVAAGISKCLRRICTSISPEEFERVICDVWFDSGRIIFLPDKKGMTGKPSNIVQLLSTFLQDQFSRILNEEENLHFSRDLSDLRHKVFQCFVLATQDEDTNLGLQELRTKNEARLFFQFGGDEDSRQELFVVWQKAKGKKGLTDRKK